MDTRFVVSHPRQRGEFVAYTLAGDAEILAPQLAGLDQPLDIPTHCFLRLRGLRLHPLTHAVEELHHADPGCARQRSNSSHQREARRDSRGRRRSGHTLVGLDVERSRRSSSAGKEEAAGVRCERESHGMGAARIERNDECR